MTWCLMEIGLSLGSNLGDRLSNLKEAKRRIAAIPEVSVIAQSPVYETSPVDVLPGFSDLIFMNAVLILESNRSPQSLLEKLKRMEKDMGRELASGRNAPRPVDADIIYAGELNIQGDQLSIPHPRWSIRRFVVQPLSDLRPNIILPGHQKTVQDQLLSLPADQKVVLLTKNW